MVKLLICLFSAAALAVTVLQLRQQHLELGYQNAELHEQIRSHQAKLWDQQLQIATFTAPNAIANTVNSHDLKLVPRVRIPAAHPADPVPVAPAAKAAGKAAAKPTPTAKPTPEKTSAATPVRAGQNASRQPPR